MVFKNRIRKSATERQTGREIEILSEKLNLRSRGQEEGETHRDKWKWRQRLSVSSRLG